MSKFIAAVKPYRAHIQFVITIWVLVVALFAIASDDMTNASARMLISILVLLFMGPIIAFGISTELRAYRRLRKPSKLS